MFGLPNGLRLRNLCLGQKEIAELVALDRNLARLRIDDRWWSEPWITREVRKRAKRDEEDYFWNWRKYVGHFQPKYWVKCVAARTEDGEIQGAMIFDPNRESVLEAGEGTVYVEYLATAPRNRETLTKSPLYRGTGTALLLSAMHYSASVGFGGRLTGRLESELSSVFGWSLFCTA